MPKAGSPAKEAERRLKISQGLKKAYAEGRRQPKGSVGWHPSLEQRRKSSLAQKGKPKPDWLRVKYSIAKKGKPIPHWHNPEAHKKAAEALRSSGAMKRKWADPEFRAKLLNHLNTLNTSPQHKESSHKGWETTWREHRGEVLGALDRGRRKTATDPILMAEKSARVKQQWQRMKPEMIKAQRRGMKEPNKKETYLLELLEEFFPNEWRYVGNGAVVIECLVPDYININNKKLLIELFGDYWHRRDCTKPYSSEEERSSIYKKYGYRMLVIWERELKLSKEEIAEKVRRFIHAGDIKTEG